MHNLTKEGISMSKQIIAISMGEAEPRLNRETIMNMFSVQGFELIDDDRAS